MRLKRGQITQGIAFGIFSGAILLIAFVFFAILFLIISNGIPVISFEFLFGEPGSDVEKGLSLQIQGTLLVSGLGTFLAMVLGLTTAIYLVEYASKTSRFVKMINVSLANLAGIPAIMFGLFAYAFFVQFIGQYIDWFQPNTFMGILSMALLEFPIIVQASKDALLRVPEGFKMAAYAVGATKWQAIRLQVLPYAWPGVITGTILALARGIGETATIIFIGAQFRIVGLTMVGLTSPFSTLSMELYSYLKSYPLDTIPLQYGIALMLLILTLVFNLLATFVRRRYQKKTAAYLRHG